MDIQIDKIGALIRDARINRGITQEELGARVGVGKAQISKIESGKGLTIKTVTKVLDALELSATVRLTSSRQLDKNVQYLVEGITKDIIVYLMEDKNMDIPSAISLFHNSETFEKLSDEATGLYIESSAYVYEILKTELKMGKIV